MINSIDLLNEGLNHLVYKVSTPKGTYIARLHPTRPTDPIEIELQNIIAKLGFTPQIIEHNQQMAIIEYIDGLHTSAHQWPDAELKQFARQLVMVHQVKPPVALPTLDLVQHLTQYRNQLVLTDIEQKQFIDVITGLKRLSPRPLTLGLCHNDLNPQNIICRQDKKYLIDWEFATLGDVFFDLAGFIVEHQLAGDKEDVFLRAYFMQDEFKQSGFDATRFEVEEKLELMKTAYRLICSFWHKIQNLK